MEKVLPSLARAARKLGIPYASTIELLAPCNLRCPHCYVSHETRNKLTRPVLLDLFDRMRNLGTFSLTLTGGEIGLRKDLFDIIAAARQRHFAIYLLSSGTRWRQPQWDQIAELGVSGVRLSLYGVTSCVHDAATQVEGSHRQTLDTARGLLERGIDVAFGSPMMAVNSREAGDLLELASQWGVSISLDPNITAMDSGDMAPKSTLATFEQLLALYRDERVQGYFERFATEVGCSVPSGDDRPCGVGEMSTFVSCTGDVYPCVSWPHSGGNILEQPYADIWFNSPVFAHARGLRNRDLHGCASCGDRGGCSPCAAMNLQDRGDVAKPSLTICESTRARTTAMDGHSRQVAVSERSRRLRIVA